MLLSGEALPLTARHWDNMAVDFLRASKQSERLGNCNIFDSLALKFLHYHFCGIPLVTQVSPIHCGW